MGPPERIEGVAAAREALWQFLRAASDGDETTAAALVFPPSRELWTMTPAEIVADIHHTLRIDSTSGQILGMSGTARLLVEPRVPQGLVGFGLVAGMPDEHRVLDGPTVAVALAMVWEDGKWWVWGMPSRAPWAEGRPIELPIAEVGALHAISVIAMEWLRALEPHLTALLAAGDDPPSEELVQHECAHSMASIALLAFAVESNAARLVVGGHYLPDRPQRDAIEVLFDRLGDDEWRAELNEIIVLRNVLAHGHVWSISYHWDADGATASEDARIYGREDPRFRRAVRPGQTTTTKLGLNIVPMSVRRDDVLRCLRTIVRTLDFIAANDPTPGIASLATIPLRIGPRFLTLQELVADS